MFREAFVREQFDFDFMYDWIMKKQAMKQRLQQAHQQRQQEQNSKHHADNHQRRPPPLLPATSQPNANKPVNNNNQPQVVPLT